VKLPVTESPFEAEFFGGPVWRCEFHRDCDLTQVAVAAVAKRVRLVTCRIPAGDAPAAAALEAAGFRRIERLVTFRRQILPVPEVTRSIVPASSRDRDACVAIALAALRQDRYHADPQIEPGIADAIKRAWVSNNLAGRADLSLVARDSAGEVVGFNQLLVTGGESVIDLIAVAPAAQHQGFGTALVAAGLHAYAAKAETMRVGTQGSNHASLALYRSAGFTVMQEQLTYHLVPEHSLEPR
jgi:ribosomal protein S18 acetylase RimI-like enzyme